MRHNMSSKKSSQAQPNRRPATFRSAGVTNGEENRSDTTDNVDAGDILSTVAALNPLSPCDLPTPDRASEFECPGWPPPCDAVLAELTTLISSGDWAKYHPDVLDRLGSTITEFLRCRHVRLVPSGSAAMEMALRAAGIDAKGQPGSAAKASTAAPEVICPALDYPGNARAVRLVGAVPVLVDNIESRWTIDPEAVAAAATPRTVAVIASHLYGEIAAVAQLRQICDRHRWLLFEDVCQMPGGRIENQPLGSFGHVATWSFGGSKPLTAGCGGAITTDDDRIAQRLAAYADRPSDAYPLGPLQAAALLPQWASLAGLPLSQNRSLTRLLTTLADQTPGWTFPAPVAAEHWPVFYKIPVTIDRSLIDAGLSPGSIIDQANEMNIPAGYPFRIPGRLAASRGRVESAERAQQVASRSWLIDHRVLAADTSGIDHLANVLIRLYKNTC
jgi:dTDP-4-amino-4,6-dideoxygalactose transaminase